MKTSLFLAVCSLVTAMSSMAHAEYAPTVEHDGRYIYYRTAFTQLSAADQTQIIDASVQLLQNELTTLAPKIPGLSTLSTTILADGELSKLTNEAQQSVTILDREKYRTLVPTGVLVYAGGSFDAGLAFNVKGSSDVGLVVVPTEVTRVDTQTNTTETYFNLDTSPVLIPHIHAGVGIGAGVTGSVGAGFIWGDLNKASDFGGVVMSAAINAQVLAGADIQGSLVRDMSQTFYLGTIEFDYGPEASANVDGEFGYVISLGGSSSFQMPKLPDVTLNFGNDNDDTINTGNGNDNVSK